MFVTRHVFCSDCDRGMIIKILKTEFFFFLFSLFLKRELYLPFVFCLSNIFSVRVIFFYIMEYFSGALVSTSHF